MKIADNNPVKHLLKRYKDYLIRQVGKHKIDLYLNTEATPELVEAGSPDVVILASGSQHIIPDIRGIRSNHAITAVDARKPDVRIGSRVVIIGGNWGGFETALYLQNLGKEVAVVEMKRRYLHRCQYVYQNVDKSAHGHR